MKKTSLSALTVLSGGLLAGNITTLLSRALMNLPEGVVAVVLNATLLTAALSVVAIGITVQVTATVTPFYSIDIYRTLSAAIGGVFIIGLISILVANTFYEDGVTAVGLAITVFLAAFLVGAFAKRNKKEDAPPTRHGAAELIAGLTLVASALTVIAARFPEWESNVASGVVLSIAVAAVSAARALARKAMDSRQN